MKNRAKNIVAIGLGVCFLALWFIFFLFITKPYTEKIVIWLPDNYELENNVKNEVVSIMSTPIDNSHQSNKVFYSKIDIDSFKKMVGKVDKVTVKIEESYISFYYYKVVYQIKYCIDNNKSLIVFADEYHRYNKRILSEMRLNDKTKTLFLECKRDAIKMSVFLFIGFIVVAFAVFLYILVLNVRSKQSNN